MVCVSTLPCKILTTTFFVLRLTFLAHPVYALCSNVLSSVLNLFAHIICATGFGILLTVINSDGERRHSCRLLPLRITIIITDSITTGSLIRYNPQRLARPKRSSTCHIPTRAGLPVRILISAYLPSFRQHVSFLLRTTLTYVDNGRF